VATAVVLLPLLVSSGLGSALSAGCRGVRPPGGGRSGGCLPAPAHPLTGAVLGLPLGWRLVVAALASPPLGFLMGTMFPGELPCWRPAPPG